MFDEDEAFEVIRERIDELKEEGAPGSLRDLASSLYELFNYASDAAREASK